ncbi:amidase [Actinomadura sp. WMMA1423]|uniref:amidase n=1 Tax=Actinomadura sp. WMMA1423 TaxID=2591108 RepID=UPI00114617F4|nr:amidase [Actinomadura sp. WMMA1423]
MGGFFTGRTLTGIGRDLRSGRESARGLVARALESVDEDLNAFAALDAEGAESAARWADEELASGIDRGPLHGVPVAVKDIIDVAGLPTGMGSGHFAGYVAEADAACVAMLRDAGAVIVGKTGTQEFAFGGSGDVSVNGAVRNPRDRERMSGGSSSGSAVAVAAGMVPLAIGTDTGGSVRIPAAFCGIAGFKPPHGVIPTGGVFPLSPSLDHVGVLAGTAEDCRVAYRALTGPAEAAPSLVDGPSGAPEGDAPYGRVAWIEPPACDPEVERRVRALFPDAPSERIDFAGLREVFLAIEYSEAYDVHAERVAAAPGLFQPATLARLEGAGAMPGWRLVRALRERDRFAEEIAALLDRYDLLAMPTMPIPAPRIGATEVGLGTLTALLVSLTSPWNVLGLPALTFPAGNVPADGGGELPAGAQLVARRGAENLLFTAAEHLAP